MTREYCSGTAHHLRVGLTDYCMCGAEHVFRESKQFSPRVTAGTVSTTVGAVLLKHSTRWYIRRQVYTKWLHWRERHLLTVQQMAIDAVAPQAAPAQSTTTEMVQATANQPTANQSAKGGMDSNAYSSPATDKQDVSSTLGSDCSVQLMAAFADVQMAWEQNWSTMIAIQLMAVSAQMPHRPISR